MINVLSLLFVKKLAIYDDISLIFAISYVGLVKNTYFKYLWKKMYFYGTI